jgi:CRP-like cAMP-binding protein
MKSKQVLRVPGDGNGVAPSVVPENALIASLPGVERVALLQRAQRVDCADRETMFAPDEPFERVLFPVTGMASVVTVLETGTTLEAMAVGREGFLGMPLFHGIRAARTKGICVIAGEFYQLAAADFESLLKIAPCLRSQLHRYAQLSSEVIAQIAACNAIHLVEERCARWLLIAADAVGRNNFNLTQECLSQMLSVRRPGVTVAIGSLERKGLIEHRYGRVSIVDVEGLRKVSCECYQTIAEKTRELMH